VAVDEPACGQRSLLLLLDHLARVARHEARIVVGDLELRPIHLIVLSILQVRGAASQKDLAAALRIDPSNLVPVLLELDQHGYIARQRDERDRRRHVVQLSSAGSQAIRRTERALAGAERRIFGMLSTSERDTLATLLERSAQAYVAGCASSNPS
jgi:DNA-binding MarR family transcriptional regulator